MRFSTDTGSPEPFLGRLLYHIQDFAFDCEPRCNGFTSVVLNQVSLEIDERNRLISVWGYCPYPRWHLAKLEPPRSRAAAMIVASDRPQLAGVSVKVNADMDYPVSYDPATGWVVISSGVAPATSSSLSPEIVIQTDVNSELVALWLHPRFEGGLPDPTSMSK